MLEEVIYFDRKGIFPKDDDTEESYVTYGRKMLEYSVSKDFKEQSMKHIRSNPRILFYSDVKSVKVKEKIFKKFYQKFYTDISSIPTFQANILTLRLDMPCVIASMISVPYKDIFIPVAIKDKWEGGSKTWLHECIHAVRRNIVQVWNGFEEAYANKFQWIKAHRHYPIRITREAHSKIKKAEKKLFDIVGDYKEYISIRLKEEEIRHIADTPNINIKEYLKLQSTLRHKIICERFGL